jgi:hypothetical protein
MGMRGALLVVMFEKGFLCLYKFVERLWGIPSKIRIYPRNIPRTKL